MSDILNSVFLGKDTFSWLLFHKTNRISCPMYLMSHLIFAKKDSVTLFRLKKRKTTTNVKGILWFQKTDSRE